MSRIIKSTDFRIKLHQHVYSNTTSINLLLDLFNEKFELFNHNYNSDTKTIEIKIKKTNIKKTNNYSHTTDFYYNIVNQIFISFLLDEEILNQIYNSGDMLFIQSYNEVISSRLVDISLLYNVTAILDNVIIVNL